MYREGAFDRRALCSPGRAQPRAPPSDAQPPSAVQRGRLADVHADLRLPRAQPRAACGRTGDASANRASQGEIHRGRSYCSETPPRTGDDACSVSLTPPARGPSNGGHCGAPPPPPRQQQPVVVVVVLVLVVAVVVTVECRWGWCRGWARPSDPRLTHEDVDPQPEPEERLGVLLLLRKGTKRRWWYVQSTGAYA